jgi:hypothetical protein
MDSGSHARSKRPNQVKVQPRGATVPRVRSIIAFKIPRGGDEQSFLVRPIPRRAISAPHSSTANPRSPFAIAKEATAVKLAQVWTFSRRERTDTHGRLCRPSRVPAPTQAPGHLGHQTLAQRVLFDQGAQYLFLNAFASFSGMASMPIRRRISQASSGPPRSS